MSNLIENAIPLLNAFLALEKLKIVGEKIKAFFLGLVPFMGPVARELQALLDLRYEALSELQELLAAFERGGAPGPQGGILPPRFFGTPDFRGGMSNAAFATRNTYTITYNVNSLRAMEDVQRRETAKMKDDEERRRKFQSAPDQGTPVTTVRTFQRRF
jgi:hypothetical protein